MKTHDQKKAGAYIALMNAAEQLDLRVESAASVNIDLPSSLRENKIVTGAKNEKRKNLNQLNKN
jgi:hypothetical protein